MIGGRNNGTGWTPDAEARRERWRRIVGRIFGDAENPMGWALPLFTFSGIRVRAHLLFVVYIVAQLLWSIPRDTMGIGFTATAMVVLFGLVLLHEFGHCFTCRWVGGDADDILMWPLGGLASCAPPHEWRANFLTTAGGPAVNLAIVPLTSAALWLTGHANAIVVNPFDPGVALGQFGSYWLVTLFWVHYINLLLFAFNVFLPMYPMDGGRLMHALIWRQTDERRASEIATTAGLVIAGVLAVFALVSQQTILLGIALLGGIVCWMERRRLREDAAALGAGYAATDVAPMSEAEAERIARREAKEAERRRKAIEEEDRILEKISRDGMGSLTRAEKRFLDRASKRRRSG